MVAMDRFLWPAWSSYKEATKDFMLMISDMASGEAEPRRKPRGLPRAVPDGGG